MITQVKIKGFLILAEVKNFTLAASIACVTQQALSAQISSLEKDIGAPLFIRTTKRVELTELGVKMQALFQEMETRYNEILRSCEGTQVLPLSIALFEDMELSDSIRIAIASLKKKYPQMQVSFTTRALFSEIDAGLENSDYTLAIVPNGHIALKQIFESQTLLTTNLYGFISRLHPLAQQGLTLADLKDVTFFVGEQENCGQIILRNLCRRHGFDPIFNTPGLPPHIERLMIEMGQGVGLGDEFSALYADEKLFRFPLNLRNSEVVAVYVKKMYSPTIQSFINEMRYAMKSRIE